MESFEYQMLFNKWFVLIGFVMFGFGVMFANVLPFMKWDLFRAEIYCELLNAIHARDNITSDLKHSSIKSFYGF
jgi:hypothetical protein